MQINGHGKIGGTRGPDRSDNTSRRPAKSAPSSSSATPAPAGDEVSISGLGKTRNKLDQVPDIRGKRVEQVRERIEQGDLVTPERVKSGIRKLLSNFF